MILHATDKIIRIFDIKYMLTHKMVNRFCLLFKQNQGWVLGQDIIDILNNIKNEEVQKLIRLNNKRKGIGIKVTKPALTSTGDLHINYNSRICRNIFNPGILYGI